MIAHGALDPKIDKYMYGNINLREIQLKVLSSPPKKKTIIFA